MEGLYFIGNIIFMVIGIVLGATIMYSGMAIIDAKFDKEDKHLYTKEDVITAYQSGYEDCLEDSRK